MADPDDPTLDAGERGDTTPDEGNPLRFTLATVMVAVLASAAGAAMVVRVYRLFGGGEAGTDLAALLLIAVVLTAVAIGCWRRSSLVAVLLQITVCCAFIAGIAEAVVLVPRVSRYTLQIWFALLVVLPLGMRRFAASHVQSEPRGSRLLALSEFLLGCGANLLLVWVGMLLQLVFIEM